MPVYTCFSDLDLLDADGLPEKARHDSEMQFIFGSYKKIPRRWTDYDRLITESVLD